MKYLAAITLVLVACTEAAKPAEKNVRSTVPPTVLVFADVTSSLSMRESDRVGTLTADVLASLAPGTRFAVHAIQAKAEAPAFCSGQMPMPRNSRETQEAIHERQKLEREVRNRLANLYCSINWNDPETQRQCRTRKINPHPQQELRSCVLDSLKHAARAAENAGGPVEIVFISDMIEECRDTSLGSAVRLTRSAIAEQTRAAAKLSFSPDLGDARVTIVLPSVLDDGSQGQSTHPTFQQVETFWKTVLIRAKADMNNWYFDTVLPRRLQRPAP